MFPYCFCPSRSERPEARGKESRLARMSCAVEHPSLHRGSLIEWLSLAWIVLEAAVAVAAGVLAHSVALGASSLPSDGFISQFHLTVS